MKRILLFLIGALCISASCPLSAIADGRAFPPDDCSGTSPFMFYSGDQNSNTKCKTGQDVLAYALPSCGRGEVVAFDGAKFYCRADLAVPNCGPGQHITGNGTNLYCIDDAAPHLACRIVTAEPSGSGLWSQPRCNDDEVVTGGGGDTEVPGSAICSGTKAGFLHSSIPFGNGWSVDSYGFNWAGDVCVRGYAVCCKVGY